ncbi:DUF6095 family protein [Altibacter sp. HG106]|uniref:DUF6095 family protein n=1 Tax=Altibacter sp. HG106 TaxID=3023937 RepID=UPI002350770C|nr:DUF6095 family protein [Altibacter sp. HG106]MDC7995625.1 DUF6095 family protein [Altibacter sp. HG106]
MKRETEQRGHTNKKLLVKGLKRLAVALPVLVLSTYVITFSFLNKETLPLYITLTLGIIFMGITLFLLFNGLRLVIRSVFGER